MISKEEFSTSIEVLNNYYTLLNKLQDMKFDITWVKELIDLESQYIYLLNLACEQKSRDGLDLYYGTDLDCFIYEVGCGKEGDLYYFVEKDGKECHIKNAEEFYDYMLRNDNER